MGEQVRRGVVVSRSLCSEAESGMSQVNQEDKVVQ